MSLFRVGLMIGLVVVLIETGIAGTFYVSPDGNDSQSGASASQAFKTIGRAREAVRGVIKGGLTEPVEVVLGEGEYFLDQPLVFGPEDSGTAAFPVTWKAQPGRRAVITGGRRIGGWKPYKDNIWMAEIPEVRDGKWDFIQLYVNGQLQRRARIPNEGFLRVAGFPDGGKEVSYHTDSQRFEYAAGDIDPNWTNLEDVEVIVYHFWTDSHLPIKSVDMNQRMVNFKHKAGKVFTDDFTADGARYVVEHVFEGLDAPGEWYLDRKTGTLYLIPPAGVDLKGAEVIAPKTEYFLELTGDAINRRYAEHLRFEGLAFEYTNWRLEPGNSNDSQGSASVPAAIRLSGARNCAFNNCQIRNISTFVFEVAAGCRENAFTHNRLEGLAAGGFRVSGGTEGQSPLLRTAGNVIADNTVGPYGLVYPSAVGILLMHTEGNRVEHNEIHHGWYTGISIGWCWGYQRSISRDNLIAYNHIHHIGQGLLSDMGAIYTLGLSPGTVIRNNLIHDVEANHYGGWGIYTDEGSSHLLIENNIVYHTKFAGFNIHYAKELTVRNNIFALGRIAQLSRGRVEPHKSCFFENNIVYFKEGTLLADNWKDEPYEFYMRPESKSKPEKMTSTFDMDWNVYFCPGKKVEDVKFAGGTWDQWQNRGKDVHSVYADPLFVDPEKYDFRLKPNSPALGLGFVPIDMSTVGPRNLEK